MTQQVYYLAIVAERRLLATRIEQRGNAPLGRPMTRSSATNAGILNRLRAKVDLPGIVRRRPAPAVVPGLDGRPAWRGGAGRDLRSPGHDAVAPRLLGESASTPRGTTPFTRMILRCVLRWQRQRAVAGRG